MLAYLQTMIWVMLFVIVVEMIFPDSDYRKYLKLVLGCIIIYILFRPVASLVLKNADAYDHLVKTYESQLTDISYDAEIQKEYNRVVAKQKEILTKAYEESIKNTIENQTGVAVISCKVTLKNNVREVFDIEKIYLVVKDQEKDNKQKLSLPEVGIANKTDEVITREEKLKNKIKTCLENFYLVQDCNIYITVQKN